MKKARNNESKHRTVRQRLFAASSMLMIAAILLTSATFAWLTLSLAPEVTGIATQVGANGSLEIALLNTTTRENLSLIQTSVGSSLSDRNGSNDSGESVTTADSESGADTTADSGSESDSTADSSADSGADSGAESDSTEDVNETVDTSYLYATNANNTWGNLIDVNDSRYGLSEITLMPARLNITQNPGSETYTVSNNILSVPTYGADGRIMKLNENTFSAIYNGKEFANAGDIQGYGVRAIGVANTISSQDSALALAKTNIASYTNSAKTAAATAMTRNGSNLMNIVLNHSMDSSALHDDKDKETLLSLLKAIQTSQEYIDLALRQGLVAYAASVIEDEDLFNEAKAKIQDTTQSIDTLLSDYKITVPDEFKSWVKYSEDLKNKLNAAVIKCNALNGGSYTWAEIKGVMDALMNLNNVYIGEKLFNNMTMDDFTALIGKDFTMTLAPGSGVLADIADFTDDLSFWLAAMGTDVEVSTLTVQDPPYLLDLSDRVKALKSAGGEGGKTAVKLSDTYGYALDMAFRCNAPLSELLLQTAALQRIDENSSSPSTMGGGSFMQFSTENVEFTIEQMLALMDAVRVAFVDDKGNVMAIAKLNTSNRTILNGVVTAPLYLYNYTVEPDEESNGNILVMGERRKTDNSITSLEQNVAKAVTTLVWLDGDLVDNTMVSASSAHSLTGILNLQFASSANLIPAENKELLSITPDKDGLNQRIEKYKETYANGQGMYTTASWTEFATAFENAESVYNNANANDSQVYLAALHLEEAALGLEDASIDVLKEKIEFYRALMGQTTDPARYVLKDDNGRYYAIDPSTQEQKANKVGDIYRVDYNKNLRDEGNGVLTPIYTDESWSNLASALYDAEFLYHFYTNEGEEQSNAVTDYLELDAALEALQIAYDALERTVYFVAYEYQGSLYYFAISEVEDTYGKWYDSNHQRIVSDLTILKLDANAVPADISRIEGIPDYIDQGSFGKDSLTPYINILDEFYSELSGEEILAVHWSVSDKFELAITPTQRSYLTDLIRRARNLDLNDEANEAQKALDQGADGKSAPITKEQADEEIAALEPKVLKAESAKGETIPETDPMTADQRTLLTTAINAAKAIEGFIETPTETPDAQSEEETTGGAEAEDKLKDLRTAVAVAEALLAQESGVTVKAANEALAAINEQLKANDVKEVTAYNTLLYPVPVGSELFEIAYAYDEGGTLLAVKQNGEDQTGTATVSAVVLTRSGIIFTATYDVQIYAKSAGLVQRDEKASESLTMNEGETLDLEVFLKIDELTEDEAKSCSRAGHVYGAWEVTKAPTDATEGTEDQASVEAQPGEKCRTCTACGHKEYSTVAVNGHSHEGFEVTLNAVEPTRTTVGLTEGKMCSDCGEILVGQDEVAATSMDRYAINETTKNYTWAIDNVSPANAQNAEVLTLTSTGGTCTVTAKAKGTATVLVSVETEQGNSYTYEFRITVQ